MKLSHYHSHIQAVLDKPEREPVLLPNLHDSVIVTHFRAGQLGYRVSFYRKNIYENPGIKYYSLMFEVVTVYGTDEEKQDFFSRLVGHPLSLEEALSWEYEFLNYRKHSLIGTGRAGEVMGIMLEIIRKFVDQYSPDVLEFSSSGKSRVKLYKKMIERYLPDSRVEVEGSSSVAMFRIIFSEESG